MLIYLSNHPLAPKLLRATLGSVFILWLSMILMNYHQQNTPKKIETTVEQSHQPILLEQLPLPPIPITSQTQTKVQPKQDLLPEKPQIDVIEKPSPVAVKTIQTTEKLYQQLTDQGLDIQIAWPLNANQRQQALHFMYQCAGLQFAVLNGHHITKLNPNNSKDDSDWIRVAQGSLSKKEQNWLTAYGLTGTAIRVFPREIDWRLAHYLANTLKGKALTSFRASYQVKNHQLFLTNIRLNKQAVTGGWMLYQGKC